MYQLSLHNYNRLLYVYTGNGVEQGGFPSHILFTVYIDQPVAYI